MYRNLYPISIRFPFVSRRLDSHSRLSPYAPAPTALVSPVTVVYFAACIAVYTGYQIRTSCFATLGRHFTFTHTTLSEHQLVKEGPYSVVRHASYSGEVLVRGGTILMLLCPGSWAYEFGVVGSRAAMGVWRVGFWLSIRAPRRVHPRLPRLLGNLLTPRSSSGALR